MANNFAVHLGGGAYLDDTGKLVFGAPANAQIYQAPGGFRIDTKKIQEAFKDLSGLLPADDDAKKKWEKWGVPKQVVNFLASIAGVASIVATAISVYVWAIGVLIAIMDLMADDDGGMSPELANTLQSIKNQLQGLEQIERADKMIAMHAEFDGRVDLMHGLLTRLAIEKPTGLARATIFSKMQELIDQLAVPLSRVRDQEWAVSYNGDHYKGRAFASPLLIVEHSNGTEPGVSMAPPTVTQFDYRLGVPMLLYAATTFAAMAQIAMPWFRSAGVYAGQLRKTAHAIDQFVIRMQNECLARTNYTPQIAFQQQTWSIFEVPLGGGPRGWSSQYTYAVGAYDLVSYTDDFLWQRFTAQFQAGEDTGPRGLFNYRWSSPSQDLDEIAAQANEQAKQDYANLQVTTGMMRLISTATWLRYLSTPPDRSQTVSGWTTDTRVYVDEQATTAKSPSIFPVGVIESPATLKRYNARNRTRITTQEPGYTPAFRYRIVLRTLHSQSGKESWKKQDYVGNIWQASYEKTAADPRLNRLHTQLHENSVLSQIVLYEGPSPIEAVQRVGEATIQASTFDWYVPILSPWSKLVDQFKYGDLSTILSEKETQKKSTASGGISIHFMDIDPLSAAVSEAPASNFMTLPLGFLGSAGPQPMQLMKGNGPLITSTVAEDLFDLGDVFALPEISLDKAERRHVATEEVYLRWQLDWKADRLEVRLFGSSQNRPYQVHVVVEESVYSGEAMSDDLANPLSDQQLREQIHTPFVAELVNQLVFVPDTFFDEERKAIQNGAKMWHEFLRRFAESRPVGPGDPIEFLEQSIREMVEDSASTSTLTTALETRAKFAAREAPELWEAVQQQFRR